MLRADDEHVRRLRRRLTPPSLAGSRPAVAFRDTRPERIAAALIAELGVACRPQHALLPGVTVDFYLPEAGVVVECQGTWFHGDPQRYVTGSLTAAQRRKRVHDAALQHWCVRAGLILVELWEDDLMRRPDWCKDRLRAALGAPHADDPASSDRLRETPLAGGLQLVVCRGDLTEQDVTAIVNAANGALSHGGGVAGAIVRRGGAVIQTESDDWVRRYGPVPTGQVALTGGGNLTARAVIHAVGPVWRDGRDGEPEQLRHAVLNSLLLASAAAFESVAMPAISSGIFGFPKKLCADIMMATVADFATMLPDSPLREVRLVNLDAPTATTFVAEFDRRFPKTAG
jgi:putative ATPase